MLSISKINIGFCEPQQAARNLAITFPDCFGKTSNGKLAKEVDVLFFLDVHNCVALDEKHRES
jgi:hypothetical protein